MGRKGLFLRIHLYTDELEICNPIGSKKIVHKVSAFYFLLGNIETKYWSTLSNIHRLLLTKYSNVKKYGLAKILQPALDDFHKLEDVGITVSVADNKFTVHGSVVTLSSDKVVTLSSDNLSAHMVGGFNGSFSCGRFCRYCMTDYISRTDKFSEAYCELRSPDTHKAHVELVVNDAAHCQLYGVRGACVFSELQYFEPINCLPPDVMHDLFEGVMQVNVEVVVKGLVRSGHFTILELNSTLASFAYGPTDVGDKPIPFAVDFVKKDKTISGKAVEKWCLFRKMVLIGDKVPPTNKFWELHLICREICAIVLAPVVDVEWIPYLELLISNHHKLLVNLSPRSFKPKVHFLTHYPRLILLYGPLRYLWCMRFEAVHQYFKQIVRRIKCFKNITGTISERFQMRKCCEQQGALCLSPLTSIPGSQHPVNLSSLPIILRNILIVKFAMSIHAVLTSVKRLTIDSSHFRVGSFIILELLHAEDIPVFLKIMYIFQHLGLWLLCGTVNVSSRYLSHFDMFSIEETNEWTVISSDEVIDFHALSCYAIPGSNVRGISVPFRICK